MRFHLSKMLMNAVGDGAGGGAAPAPAAAQPAPADAPAPGAALAVDPAVRAAEQRGRDAAFAEMRRTGALRSVPPAGARPAEPGAQPANPTAEDPRTLARSLDRSITRLGVADRISEAHWRRAERDFLAEAPADPDAWVRDYFPGLAAAPGTTDPAQPASPAAAPLNARPASGAAGAPAPRAAVPLDQMNILDMSPADVANHVARIGVSKFKEQYAAALRGKRISLVP